MERLQRTNPARRQHTGETNPGDASFRHRVELRLLGGFELLADGITCPMQPAGQRLLAFVALAPRGVARMFAAFQLWPDADERRAMANLRSTLWRLKRSSVDVIEVRGERLRVPDHVWIDVRDGLEEETRRADSSDAALLPFRSALADLLPDWYDDWLLVERERYRQWRLHLLESRADRSLDSGKGSEALQLALAALAIDPSRDRAHQLVIAAHRLEGNGLDERREHVRYERCLASMGNIPDGGLRSSHEVATTWIAGQVSTISTG